MAQPDPGAVHVNTPLTNISLAFVQADESFIADKAFPVIPVEKRSDAYFTYDRGFFFRNEMDERAPGTESKGAGYEVSTDSYLCRLYAVHQDIPDQVRANEDSPLNSDRDTTILVTQKALIKREKLFASSMLTTSVWTTDITGVAAAPGAGQVLQWNDAASNPIEDVTNNATTVQRLTGFRPRTLVCGRTVWDILKNHPDMVDRIKYGQTPGSPAIVTKQAVAALMELDEILVMESTENTAAEGAANVFAFIGGKVALLLYKPSSPGIMTPSAGYTFAWTGYTGMTGVGHRVKKFRMDPLAADRVECEAAFVHKKVSADLGVFFTAIVA
jgi:hypothetical protein